MTTRHCAACDAPVRSSAGNCPECGTVLPVPTLHLPSGPPAQGIPAVGRYSELGIDNACPACGALADAGAAWCAQCLLPLRVAAPVGSPIAPAASQPRPVWTSASPTSVRAVRYASWDQRVGASLIDAMVMVLVPLTALLYSRSLITLSLLAMVMLFCWNVVYLQGTTGQTLGKAKIGISLRGDTDGQPIGVARCFWRQLAHCVDGIGYLGYLWPIWDSKHQTFADKICGTVVIVG